VRSPAKQPSLRFHNTASGQEVDSIWDELLARKLWRRADFLQHEKNVLSGYRDRTYWKPVLPPWITLEPEMSWCHETTSLVDPVYFPVEGVGSMDDFLAAVQRLFKRFEGNHIGVQLSGGFDSSLTIGLLKHFGIRYSVVGLISKRYEFRTERRVQEKLAAEAESVELIDESEHLPCSHLEKVPAHQIPDLLSLNFSQDCAMTQACRTLGIDVLFSGGGGDNLFMEAVPERPELCQWRPQIFTDPFPADVVYYPNGIKFLSFYGEREIVDSVFRLRRGQDCDLSKLWARHFFRDFLPRELTDFAYCADFWGRDMDGLHDAMPSIRAIHRSAAEATGSEYFNDERLEELLKEDLLQPEKSLYHRLEARISNAVWINSLKNLRL
jgi:hypothetical protein